jgi:hypothetical protein
MLRTSCIESPTHVDRGHIVPSRLTHRQARHQLPHFQCHAIWCPIGVLAARHPDRQTPAQSSGVPSEALLTYKIRANKMSQYADLKCSVHSRRELEIIRVSKPNRYSTTAVATLSLPGLCGGVNEHRGRGYAAERQESGPSCQRSLKTSRRKVATAWAPEIVQRLPAPFMRAVPKRLQALSASPLPIG